MLDVFLSTSSRYRIGDLGVMPATKVRLSVSITLNAGNYESVKVEAGMERELALGETTKQAYDMIYKELYIEVRKKAYHARRKVSGEE